MMFKQNKITFFSISLIIFLLLGFLFNFLIFKKSDNNIDINKVQNIINNKEDISKNLIDYYSNELLTKSFNAVTKENASNLDNLYKSKNLSILIYDKHNNLKIWSDNIISNSELLKNTKQSNYVGVYNNHLVEVIKRKINNKTFFVLIHIKVVYPFKNQFLNNHFIGDFKILKDYRISLLKSKNDISIYDKNNNFLFSLVKNEKVTPSKTLSLISLSFFLLAFIFLILICSKFIKKYFKNNFSILGITAFGVILLLIRFLLLKFKIPSSLSYFDFFNPLNFASSFWFPSLGDFFINAIFILIFAYFLFKYLKVIITKKNDTFKISVLTTASIIFTTTIYLLLVNFIKSLLFNSNISLEPYKILDISLYSIIAYLIIASLFLSFIIIFYKLLELQVKFISNKKIIIFYVFVSAIVFIISFIFSNINFISIANFYIILILLLLLFKIKAENKFSFKVLIIFILSIYTSVYILNKSAEKEINQRKVLILNLSNQRDLIAELLFEKYEKQLKTDKVLSNYMQNPFINIDKINNYLLNNYFHGYLNKYDFQTTICGNSDSLIINNQTKTVNCYNYFYDYIKSSGTKVNNTNFYFLENSNGRISYITNLTFYNQLSEVTLFIEIDSKLISEELGYPELLLDSKIQKTELLKNYSYAKYYNNKLITQGGNFKFNLINNYLPNPKQEFTVLSYDNFSHLIYKVNNNNVIILSSKISSFTDYLISQSYIFSFYFLIFIIILLFYSLPFNFNINNLSFNSKFQISILSILLILFTIIIWITIIYNKNIYYKNQHKIISEKTESVLIEMQHKFGQNESLNSDIKEYLLYVLTKFSNVFYSDINLYDTNGFLITSSRPEIIEKGLTSDRMNPIAYREMVLNKKSIFVQTENIGDLNYQSSYVPFKNNSGKILAYLNLPYFTKQNKIKQEISNIIAAIINLYVLIIVIAIIIIILISNKITQPLRLIKNKLKQIKITGKPELIDYKSNDEVGDLVFEYNELARELDQYIIKLSKLERETAWRQMAKQIAHEIKNPLTPMKLSVQYLKKSWNNKSENFDKQISNTTKTLIEQIDTLANIASAFSDFASMPIALNEKIDIIKLLNDSLRIFYKTPNCKIVFDYNNLSDIFIFADRNQLIRVFNNITKNAIQSIPSDRFGNIKISIKTENKFVTVMITDNGEGISDEVKEKLFEPNFTTKSSGSGLGLYMVKNILENANGKIWFKTEIEKGTTFFIKLPQIS